MGEEKLVVMLAGLNIELAALKAIADGQKLLRRPPQKKTGRADLCTSHPGTRKAHQASETSLYILQRRPYKKYISPAIPQIVQ